MAGVNLSGLVVYKFAPGLAPLPVKGAVVTIIDKDVGGNGNDTIFTGTTTDHGYFDALNVNWEDSNTVAGQVKVPSGHPGLDDHGRPIWVDTSTYISGQLPIPDVLDLVIHIDYNGVSESYPYVQLPGGRTIIMVQNPNPEDMLPQYDPLPQLRAAAIAVKRQRYQWSQFSTTFGTQVVTLNVGCLPTPIPPDELPDAIYIAGRTAAVGKADANKAAVVLTQHSNLLNKTGRFSSIAAYKTLYPLLPNPADDISIDDDRDVIGDTELQAWRNELQDPNLGRLGTMPTLKSRDELEAMLTQVVFSCSALHSAVNYSQWKYQGYIPNSPAAGWADWHLNPPLTDFLPNANNSNDEVKLAANLTMYQYDRLGNYSPMQSQLANVAIAQFNRDLQDLAKRVDKRNGERVSRNDPAVKTLVDYPFLHPDRIAGSISV